MKFKVGDKVRLNIDYILKRLECDEEYKDNYLSSFGLNMTLSKLKIKISSLKNVIFNIDKINDSVFEFPISLEEDNIIVYQENELKRLKPYKRIIKNIVKNM